MKLYNLNGIEKATVVENKDVIVREIANAELQNGWRSNGGLTFLTKINNVVTLYLLIRDGTSGVGILLFNLPEQFRPVSTYLSFANSKIDKQYINVYPNGDVILQGSINSESVFLQTSWLTN